MKTVLKILFVLVIAAVVLLMIVSRYVNGWAWEEVSSKLSPNEKYGLYLYNNISDHDRHAPYGTYIFLHAEFKLANPADSDVIFAGYCKDDISYNWLSDDEISISCTGEGSKIRTASRKILGITVNIKTAKPHNQSVQQTRKDAPAD